MTGDAQSDDSVTSDGAPMIDGSRSMKDGVDELIPMTVLNVQASLATNDESVTLSGTPDDDVSPALVHDTAHHWKHASLFLMAMICYDFFHGDAFRGANQDVLAGVRP